MFDPNNIQDTGLRYERDARDFKLEDLRVEAPVPFDWNKGYDCERELRIKINFKNQGTTKSCVGQAWAYLLAVINAKETGVYDEVSAKAIYSQIFLDGGGAEVRDGALLAIKWGAVLEKIVKSYRPDGSTDEYFMQNKSWLTPAVVAMAKVLQAKALVVVNSNMESIAQACRDYGGVVIAVHGENNGTWSSNEPLPPTYTEWNHALFIGKAGTDKLSRFISTPNSWGTRNEKDELHPDDYQKLRSNWFAPNNNVFACYTLIDKPNIKPMTQPYIVQIKGTKNLGIITPELSDFIKEAQAVGINLHLVNGVPDWSKIHIEKVVG